MAIKIEMLKCFTAVVSHGSLADAADSLGRTSSAVSMMLKQFEDHVGAPLFETARKSRLTPLGELIYAEARREVSHFQNTVSVIEGLSKSEVGYLRLAVTPSVATTILPAVVTRFVKNHPKVQLDIRDMDSATIVHELSRERADIGIGTFGEMDGMNRAPLFSDHFGVVCRRNHDLARNWDKLTWKDLHDHVFIANGLCHLITDEDFAPILASSRLMVPNVLSLLALVREDIGITLLPRLALRNLEDEFAFLPLVDASARREVHIVSQSKHMLMPVARAFWDLIGAMSRDGTLVPTGEHQNT